jgi:hypothetical protein
MLRKAFRAIDLEKAREGKKGLMTPAEARERTDNARELNKAIQSSAKAVDHEVAAVSAEVEVCFQTPKKCRVSVR